MSAFRHTRPVTRRVQQWGALCCAESSIIRWRISAPKSTSSRAWTGSPPGGWYLAGSNTCVYSYPPNRDELGATQHDIEVSNCRFRDDKFLVPRELTQDKISIWGRVKFTPVNRPLVPGQQRAPTFLAWSEFRYTAYSFVMPKFMR